MDITMLNLLHRNVAPAASRILRPGLANLPERVERYPVPGAGSVTLEVRAGDQLTLVDKEGGQVCEVLFCDSSGRFDPGALGAVADGTGEGLKAMLAHNAPDAARTLLALKRRGIALAAAKAAVLFGSDSRAGSSASFTVSRDGLLIVA
ncbi:MAG TPA: aminomethyltransferase, partial [Tabrizicola sp.]